MGNVFTSVIVITCNALMAYAIMLEVEKIKPKDNNSNKGEKKATRRFLGWNLNELPSHTSIEVFKKVILE